MRSLKFVLAVVITFLSLHVSAQDQILTVEQTPQKIRSYLQTHFPENKILVVKKEKEFSKVEYEVKLDGKIELKFDKNFVVKDIESKTALPDDVVPQVIRNYAAEKYPNNAIVAWEKKRKKQKVELDNDLDLYFDLNGKFIRLDD